MTDCDKPLTSRTAAGLGLGRKGQDTLLVYPNRVAHVTSQAPYWGGLIGLTAITIVSFALAGGGPGALGALIRLRDGPSRQRRHREGPTGQGARSGSTDAIVIPLKSIVSVQPGTATTRRGQTRTNECHPDLRSRRRIIDTSLLRSVLRRELRLSRRSRWTACKRGDSLRSGPEGSPFPTEVNSVLLTIESGHR